MERKFCKNDLRSGMTVKLKGYEGLCIVYLGFARQDSGNIIGSKGENHVSLDAYDLALNKDKADDGTYIIEKVWSKPIDFKRLGKPCTDRLLYSRVKEMTVAEIEKVLGITNLKIVKD